MQNYRTLIKMEVILIPFMIEFASKRPNKFWEEDVD